MNRHRTHTRSVFVVVSLMVVTLMVATFAIFAIFAIFVVFAIFVFDRVEKRVDVVFLAADEPDHDFVTVVVGPRQHALDAVPVDRDVVAIIVDRCNHGELNFGVGWLIAEDLDQFAHSHGSCLSEGAAVLTGVCLIDMSLTQPFGGSVK